MNHSRKALVAYFSCSGVTKRAAEALAAAAGADLYEIRPQVPYTKADLDWTDKNARSTLEMQDKHSRPGIIGPVPDMAGYDAVFLGFPIWWYVAPTIINSFLEQCSFSGQTLIPFATSGGSGFGRTLDALRPSCPDSVRWEKGKLLNGKLTAADLETWVRSLGL